MATEKKNAEQETTKVEQERYFNEPVEIELFKDEDRYKDDVFVAVNGKRFRIQRGVRVTVPRYIALEVERSLAQKKAAAAVITYYSGKQQVIGE
ncbi:MAG: hypothetical protein IJL83_02255 [Clostridia bacterium]|nr:hypothetical protein [Clostridia bacterium]